MRYYISVLLSALIFIPLNLNAQFFKNALYSYSTFDNALPSPDFSRIDSGKRIGKNIAAKINNTNQDEITQKMYDFLRHYDKKISEAHNNAVYQAKISSYKKQKPSKVYNGKDFNNRAMKFYKKIKLLRNNFNERAQRLKMPSSYGKPIYPERYISVEYDERMCMKMTFEYYNYILSCTSGNVDANIAKYLLSDRMSLLLDIANDAIIVEDMPTFYWTIDEISTQYIKYKYNKPVIKHIFTNAESLGI